MVEPLTKLQRVLLFAIVTFAVLSRVLGLGWDEGLMLHPDERNLVTAAARLSFPNKLVPDFHAYNGLAVYLPRILAESAFTRDPPSHSEIALAARAISAFFSMALVPVLFAAARRMFGNASGLWTAFVVACAPAMIQAAHFGTTESALSLATGLCIFTAAYRADRKLGEWPAALAYGGIIGLGLGFKTTAASLALFPIVDCALRFQGGNIFKSLFWLVLTGLVSLVLLLVTTPQILGDPQNYFAALIFEANVVSGKADVFWTYQFHARTHGLFEASQLPWMLGIVPAVFLLPGGWLLATAILKQRRPHVAKWATGLYLLVYLCIVFTWHAKFIRYLMPVMPIFAILGANAVHEVSGLVRGVWKIPVASFAVFATALGGIDQAAIYGRQDPRVAAWEWLLPQLQTKAVLVLEPVETGPPFDGAQNLDLKVLHLPLIAKSGDEKVNEITQQLSEGNWMLISSRRHSSVLPRMRERFPEMCNYYAALWKGELGYTLEASFSRRSGFSQWFNPGTFAEETFTVFDSPTVFALVNSKQLSAAEIKKRLQRSNPACEKQ